MKLQSPIPFRFKILGRRVGLPACMALALAFAGSAHAGYDGHSTSTDITRSCKNFSVNSSGVLSLTCNRWDTYGVDGTRDYTIDLDDKVTNSNTSLAWASSGTGDFTSSCQNESVALNSSDNLMLSADCTDVHRLSYWSSSLRIDQKLENKGFINAGTGTKVRWKP